MGLIIHEELVNETTGKELESLCPFGALTYKDGKIDISAGCKLCKICVNRGPKGVITFEEEKKVLINKDEYKGVCVYADIDHGITHKVTFELIGKAKELASVINHPVYAIVIGYNTKKNVDELLSYGVDKVFVYDHKGLDDYDIEKYTNCFEDFIKRIKPSSILVGATNVGRSLAPRVAARFHTGLTADCTKLEMKENTDLVQIRPAFGGNIMAQIINPNNRPQFATVRYKIFNAPSKVTNPSGIVENVVIKDEWLESRNEIIEVVEKPKELDIAEADVIVAVGRGLKSTDDLKMVEELANELNAVVACTRPLVEAGVFDSKHQIGLSGKTVKPKLIITLGISGAIQFTSGMNNSDCIIAINNDPDAQIFNVANYCIIGDIYDIVPKLIEKIKEEKANV
ncbi:MAG: electron transfer flavoprotein subunit alpha/FixB family protein [Erysipelotrichaceae bacterium]|nr:electron transfer flavoprotein subunit alpha/FixB family protein [Erysipelotrichaceae bacterium]